MADGKIYITISNSQQGGQGIIDQANSKVSAKKDENNLLGAFAVHKLTSLIESEAQTMVNYSLGNIGNFTGNYNKQNDVNATLQALNFAKSVGTSFISGVAVGGVVGGLIAGSIDLISKGINYALQEKSNRFENHKQNYEIQKLRDIAGIDGTTNGGRI